MQKNEPKTVKDYLELADKCIEEGDTRKAREYIKKASEINKEILAENLKGIETDK